MALSHCAWSMLVWEDTGRLTAHQLLGLSVLVTLCPVVSRHLGVGIRASLFLSEAEQCVLWWKRLTRPPGTCFLLGLSRDAVFC